MRRAGLQLETVQRHRSREADGALAGESLHREVLSMQSRNQHLRVDSFPSC
jgi:hypothetical protein